MALFLGTVYFWRAFLMIMAWTSGLVEQTFFFDHTPSIVYPFLVLHSMVMAYLPQ